MLFFQRLVFALLVSGGGVIGKMSDLNYQFFLYGNQCEAICWVSNWQTALGQLKGWQCRPYSGLNDYECHSNLNLQGLKGVYGTLGCVADYSTPPHSS